MLNYELFQTLIVGILLDDDKILIFDHLGPLVKKKRKKGKVNGVCLKILKWFLLPSDSQMYLV